MWKSFREERSKHCAASNLACHVSSCTKQKWENTLLFLLNRIPNSSHVCMCVYHHSTYVVRFQKGFMVERYILDQSLKSLLGCDVI
jgi:hypothetical protein